MSASGGIPSDWPLPEPEAQKTSDRLLQRICARIEQCGGTIPFSRYMDMVLNEPGLGYYSAGARKFGVSGDFVTAPEISPLFSHCVARAVAPVLAGCETPVLMEVGAGSGVMAAEILRMLDQLDCLPGKYLVLERSADLRERQQQTLLAAVPNLFDCVEWLDHLPGQPFEGAIIGNEVLDALPVDRFTIRNGDALSVDVGCDGTRLFDVEQPLDDSLAGQWLSGLPESVRESEEYRSEFCRFEPWLAALADILSKGAMLWIDYGYPRAEYYHAQRSCGTLMSYYRHRAHDDVFLLPGLQDITAHVDFTRLAEAAETSGLSVSGFATQAAFLSDAGIDDLFSRSVPATATEQLKLAGEIRRLMLPGEMGERFKCMLLTRDVQSTQPGFRGQDLRGRL